MGVWINRDLDALVPGTMQVTPIQVEARWVCIDFDTDAVVGGGIDYCIHVQGIAFPAQQDTTGGMPNDVDIGVGDGAEHAPGLFLRREIELAVNRGNNEIQGCQHLIREVECAVAQNVAFCAFEDTDATGVLCIQTINLFVLTMQGFFVQAVCIGCCLAMIGNTQVDKSTRNTRFSHFT